MEPEQNQPFTPQNPERRQSGAPPSADAPQITPPVGSPVSGEVPPSPGEQPQFPPQQFMPANNRPPQSKKMLFWLIVMTILIIAGAAGALFIDKKDSQKGANNTKTEQSKKPAEVTVPTDWKEVDTTIGFSVKVPARWSAAPAAEATFGNIKTTSVYLGNNDTAGEMDGPIVVASKQSLTDTPGQQAFEEAATKLDAETIATLEQLGVKKEDVSIKSKHVTLGGKQWLQIDTQYPGQFTRTLYLWNTDHEIGLSVLSDGSDSLSEAADAYLLPMAASVIVK